MNESIEIKYLRDLIQHCHKCEVSTLRINQEVDFDKTRGKVFSSGNSNAKIMIIGESPFHKRGTPKDGILKPFSFGDEKYEKKIGSSKILFDALWKADVKRDDLYVTNLMKCSYNEKLKDNMQTYFKECYPLMKIEIKLVRPKVIFLLGNNVKEFFHDKIKIGEKTKSGIWIFAIYHPAYIWRQRHNKNVVKDYEKAIYNYLKVGVL